MLFCYFSAKQKSKEAFAGTEFFGLPEYYQNILINLYNENEYLSSLEKIYDLLLKHSNE